MESSTVHCDLIRLPAAKTQQISASALGSCPCPHIRSLFCNEKEKMTSTPLAYS